MCIESWLPGRACFFEQRGLSKSRCSRSLFRYQFDGYRPLYAAGSCKSFTKIIEGLRTCIMLCHFRIALNLMKAEQFSVLFYGYIGYGERIQREGPGWKYLEVQILRRPENVLRMSGDVMPSMAPSWALCRSDSVKAVAHCDRLPVMQRRAKASTVTWRAR